MEEIAVEFDALALISKHLSCSDEQLTEICIEIINHSTFDHGVFQSWTATDKHKSKLIHVLIMKNKPKTIKNISPYVNMNEPRTTDQCTPLHLSAWTQKPELIDLLIELGCDKLLKNKYGEDCAELVKRTGQRKNIAFLDLELTDLPSVTPAPHILEIALIITDKDLNELERGHWIVQASDEILSSISKFGLETFKDESEGGNNLIADIKAKGRPMEEVSKEVLDMLQRHCPPKLCPLGGSSVQCDAMVLKDRMPAIYEHMSHQIIDVSTVLGLCARWNPKVLSGLWNENTKDENTNTAHRAMYDVERSISALQYTRLHAFAAPPPPAPLTSPEIKRQRID